MGQLYFVRAIGTEQVSEHEPVSLENAKEDLVDLYQKTLENHDNGSWFDDKLLENDHMSFEISGEEFFQRADVLALNTNTGAAYYLEELRRLADEADIYAKAYEYELQSMGVYEVTSEINRILNQLENYLKQCDFVTEGENKD